MASWQAHIVTFLIKAQVKRHFRTQVEVEQFRKRLSGTARVTLPPGWQVRTVARDEYRDEWIEPIGAQAEKSPVILYLHGGGYVACSPRTHRPLTVALATTSGVRCLALDYPLAPEYPFPAALNTAVAAYQGLLESGIAPTEIILAGDSAGGGLALSLLLTLRQIDRPLPAGAVLFSPLTDLAATGDSLTSNERHDAFFYGYMIKSAAQHYLGSIVATDPVASPLYADLSGLPALFIHVSEHELLRDDGLRLAERAREQHVPVTLRIWSGVPHVWQIFTPLLPEAQASIREAAAFIQQRLQREKA